MHSFSPNNSSRDAIVSDARADRAAGDLGPPARPAAGETEPYGEARQAVVTAVQTLLESGLLMATGGNVSTRLPGAKHFAITPSNRDYASMVAADICVLDFDRRRVAGEFTPSVESGMHAAIYRARPDVQAIVHTHQVFASALTLIDAPLPALFDEQARFLGRRVDIIPYAPSGTGFLERTVARHVRSHHNAFLMKNHGVLVFGHDLERAVHNAELLEKCAHAYLLALAAERPVGRIPLVIREIAFAKLRGDQRKAARGRRVDGGE